jgi:signal transduction histidine kinase
MDPGSQRPEPVPGSRSSTDLRRVLRYEATLRHLLRDLTSPLTIKDVGRRIAQASRELFAHDAFVLVLCVTGPHDTQSVYVEDTPSGARGPEEMPAGPAGPSAIAQEFSAGRGSKLVNRPEEPRGTPFEPFGQRDRLSRSLLYAGVRWQGELMGFLSAQSYTPGRYGEADLEELQSFADLLGGVLARLRLEEQLRRSNEQLVQAQKMESLGRLAGGIAHDFNNLLTVILGFGQLMQAKMAPGHPFAAHLQEILSAGERAASLTRQLLAISRRQVLELRVLDPAVLLSGFEKMIRRVIGEDIEIHLSVGKGVGNVRADASQLEQVLLNLAVNARDAMPRGGKITLEAAHIDIDERFARDHEGLSPGPYVMIAVADTGAGMSPAVLSHLFEPFFTTKEPGKGTGLGLSTAYGIIRQSGGRITVESRAGQGSVFRIYLAEVPERASADPSDTRPIGLVGGTERILLVEDERSLQRLMGLVLRSSGYEVLEAGSAQEALLLAGGKEPSIDLLVTDVVMPEMRGPELTDRLTQRNPGLGAVYVSGYAEELSKLREGRGREFAFLQKPFTLEALLSKIRSALDARVARA